MNQNTEAWIGTSFIGAIMGMPVIVSGIIYSMPELIGVGIAVGLFLTGFLRSLLRMLEEFK